jgi:L-alanine-DL-glutamate epimerase-like enolase superfamily enzyme
MWLIGLKAIRCSACDSTVLIIETDSGLTGVGEVCPLGPSYLAAYAEGARSGLARPMRDSGDHHDHRRRLGRRDRYCSSGSPGALHATGFHFQSSAFHEYHSLKIAYGAPVIKDGYMVASSAPGLGVTPDMAILGKPVLVIGG